MPTVFSLNGVQTEPDLAKETPLIFCLRNDLELKGTRLGCGTGDCGACTVLVDGRPGLACTIQLGDVAGRHVETIESLTANGRTDPVIEAVVSAQAGQCGYCLAGIVMRATVLLRENTTPTRAEIATALDACLCRCGAHSRILSAVQMAASGRTTDGC